MRSFGAEGRHDATKRPKRPPCGRGSATKAELRNYRAVTLYVIVVQVVEKAATLANHHQQAPAAMVVFLVNLEVFSEVDDTTSEKRDLHLGRPSVGVVEAVLSDRGGFI